ncbi:MAG: Asp-tRNA(Asn)/Glu-tRNA(Gln) amidotransferase subunit GatC [Caldiserica bacterium]|jgi:aspartyl-tRNA(Asn)/glutamyl-tRNA(Gln) amidotransferase subunit C|nr:Asp-tRNA(Asn)/Glu-tRNA(Gln) amidotransferase subunit GatC [Caldisericota bacterium]MDH7562277.1 Asp-tRNA(Asn)/Glu-tRNA(Gln) amidotransferase subunit GatC [Caldisericota bacterium]
MKISLETLKHIAHLARLEFSPDELSRFYEQMVELLDHFARISELDTEDVPPTFGVLPLYNVMREDKPGETLKREEALMNAPEQEEGFFKIPTILEGEN